MTHTFWPLLKGLLNDGYHVRFRAHGSSMAPTILDGDQLRVEAVEALNVRIGDVLVCDLDRGVTAHRLVRCARSIQRDDAYFLRGDASCDEERISPSCIAGRVIAVERAGRRVLFSRSWFGRWRLVYIWRQLSRSR